MTCKLWRIGLPIRWQIAARDVDYRDIGALAQRAAEGQARAERAQWAAQWREQALTVEQAGQTEAAHVAAQRWLEMAPGDEEARGLVERLSEARRGPDTGPVPREGRGQDQLGLARLAETLQTTAKGMDWRTILKWAAPIAAALVLYIGIRSALEMRAQQREVTQVAQALSATQTAMARVEPTTTSQPVPTDTPPPPTPTETPQLTATNTPKPTLTPVPTVTDTPESTHTSAPTATSTLTPKPTLNPAATPLPAPVAGSTRVWDKDSSVMVYVPAGEFLMGSEGDPDADDDEQPQHTVYLDAFWIDRTEVTNAQYRRCVESGTCRAPTTCNWGEPTYSDPSKRDHPVVCVSWQGAEDYCAWAGKSLPTEAQWEKAARGTDGRIHPWGNEFDCHRANLDDETEIDDYVVPGGEGCDGFPSTAPVGSFPDGASPYGALDMAGNVWEWVADWYDGSYYGRSPKRNPTGPDSGEFRALRGGSWTYTRFGARCATRRGGYPVSRNELHGFRCCVAPTSSP